MTDLLVRPTPPRTNPPPALVVDDVSKSFGAATALDGVSFSLGASELLALVGPSGCGKSTLLRIVAGLIASDRGRIELAGRVVEDGSSRLPPERRNIGLVFQDHALFPHLTVERNLAFGIRDTPKPEVSRRVDEVLALVGLDRLRARYPHELSGGERQRVALARALAPRPTLLLLDEPFASLDTNLRSQIRTDVVSILRDAGTPAVFVTHDQSEALAVGDRVVVMQRGRILQDGDPYSVFHHPRDRFVGAFMGEAHFVPVQRSSKGWATELGVAVDPIEPPGPAMVAMIRPDDVTVGSVSGPDDVRGEIVGVEFRGATWCYRVKLPSGSVVGSVSSHLRPLDVGDQVGVALTPGHRPVVVAENP